MKNRKSLFITLLSTISFLALTWCTSTTVTPEEDTNTTENTTTTNRSSEMYTEEEIQAAKDLIAEDISNWSYRVENLEIEYDGDSLSKDFLLYCQNKNPDIIESASFSVKFYIPEQETPLPEKFEGKRNVDTYVFFLGRTENWEWEIVNDWIW